MQWTRVDHPCYQNFYTITYGDKFFTGTETQYGHKIFLIALRDWGLVMVEICPSQGHNSRSEGHFDCIC